MISGEPGQAEDVLVAAENALARILAEARPRPNLSAPAKPADAVRWAGDRMTEFLAEMAEWPLAEMLAGATTEQTTPAADGVPLHMVGAAGDTAECQIWIHQLPAGGDRIPQAHGHLWFALTELSCGDLRLSAAGGRFAPDSVSMAAGAGRLLQTRLSFTIPAAAVPGQYRGQVVASGAADAAIELTVVVT